MASPQALYAGDAEVAWKPQWPQASWVEAVVSVGLLVGPAQLARAIGRDPTPRWRGPVLLDEEFQDLIIADSASEQKTWEVISDIPFTILQYYPIVVDSLLVGWYVHDDAEVAINTGIIGLQSLAMVSVASLTTQWLVARERPRFPEGLCEDPARFPDTTVPCGPRPAVSFFSGHAAVSFNGAGLICAVHENIPLYGGGFWDGFACGAALAGASLTAVARMANNDHYLSDVIVGTAVGLLTGYVVPTWLHFGWGDEEPLAPRARIAPVSADGRHLLTIEGSF